MGVTVNGVISGRKFTQAYYPLNLNILGKAAETITPFNPGASSFQITIEPGAVYFFEIPVGVAAPPPSVAFQGLWSTTRHIVLGQAATVFQGVWSTTRHIVFQAGAVSFNIDFAATSDFTVSIEIVSAIEAAVEETSDLERLFIAESPPNLWPESQSSYFGAFRKSVLLPLEECIETQEELYRERFPDTSEGYLTRWERDLGLPIASPDLTIDERRSEIITRLKKGPFTRERRIEIVESFIRPTFGIPTDFSPDGIPLTPAGVTMFSAVGDVDSFYTIVENIAGYSYTVSISNGVDPDIPALTRVLRRATPAGITFTITRF
jgi:hypothetical protein